MAFGGVAAGMVLYLDEGTPVFHYNWFEEERYIVRGPAPIPVGESSIRLDFKYDGGGLGKGGTATISINDEQVSEGRIEKTVAGRFGVDTFGIGEDSSQPVTFDYKPPFRFDGTISKVTLTLTTPADSGG